MKKSKKKTCSMCNTEKHIKVFYKNHTECQKCDHKKRLKHYYDNKDNRSNQRKTNFEKSKDKLLPHQNERNFPFTGLVRSYVPTLNLKKC